MDPMGDKINDNLLYSDCLEVVSKLMEFLQGVTIDMVHMLDQLVQNCVATLIHVPCGKILHNYGKSPSLIGKSTNINELNGPLPVVPHKAVAEVSEYKTYRRSWLLWIRDGRANPLIDRKMVGVVFAGVVAMVAVVTSPTTAGCSVMYCNCSCSCSVVEL